MENKKSERISVEEASEILGMSKAEIRYRMKSGDLAIGAVDPPKPGGKHNRYRIYRRLVNKEVGICEDGY